MAAEMAVVQQLWLWFNAAELGKAWVAILRIYWSRFRVEMCGKIALAFPWVLLLLVSPAHLYIYLIYMYIYIYTIRWCFMYKYCFVRYFGFRTKFEICCFFFFFLILRFQFASLFFNFFIYFTFRFLGAALWLHWRVRFLSISLRFSHFTSQWLLTFTFGSIAFMLHFILQCDYHRNVVLSSSQHNNTNTKKNSDRLFAYFAFTWFDSILHSPSESRKKNKWRRFEEHGSFGFFLNGTHFVV